MKPAGQPDGWIDEGWNTYHDNGGATVDPFDFTELAQTLCRREPYSRVTPLSRRTAEAPACSPGSRPPPPRPP